MTNVQEICVDLGSFGDMLGTLTPTFGLAANCGPMTAEQVFKSSTPAPRELLFEIAKLGSKLVDLSPREVANVWES